jgi:ribosomal protein S6
MVTKNETAVKEILLNDYELVYIVHPEVADDALDPVINNITQFITGKGGAVSELVRWGRKKLYINQIQAGSLC